jgi:hypothetical protein
LLRAVRIVRKHPNPPRYYFFGMVERFTEVTGREWGSIGVLADA